jgi:quercetin dioxygenase-like cupin family protein
MRHHVMLTVVAAMCAVAFASRASAQAAATPSAGPIVVHAPDIRWADGPPFLPRGAQFALLEGNPAEAVPLTLRLKLPPNYRLPPHWHSVLEHVTVLSGTLYVGMGEQATYTGGTALLAGSYAVVPQKMVHSAWTGSDGVVFQLHSVGPWSITYVNPKDDPRQARP